MPVHINNSAFTNETLKPALIQKTRSRRSMLQQESVHHSRSPAPRNDLRPALAIEQRDLNALKMPKRQARKLGPNDVAKVANSIRQYGFCVPIIIGKDGRIIDGVATIEAARSLGFSSVPCVLLDHLSASEERALRLALNQLGSEREYDLPVLKLELEELLLEHQPIRLLGFSDAQLDIVLSEEAPATAPAPAESMGPPSDPVTSPGDMWRLGNHLLICGDAKLIETYQRLMEGGKAQLALTDPPYAVAVNKVVSTKHRDFIEGGGDMDQAQFEAMIEATFRAILSVLVDGGMLLSFMDYKHVCDLILIGGDLGYSLMNLITWVKSQGGMGSLWRSRSEFVVALKKPGKHKNNVQLGDNGRDRTNVWEYAGAGTLGSDARKMLEQHPTPKPVPMLVDAIYDVTDAGDIVLDPFGGSGSTLMACEETGRIARMIELDPRYCDVIVRRWQEATGGHAILDGTNDRFAAVADQRAVSNEVPNNDQ
jgi:DNA modification methylase